MFIVVLFAVYVMIVSSQFQFPNHIDLEKIAQIDFNDEKYNVLRPTLHVVKDNFKDFMLKRKSSLSTNRIFVDDNGFRHYWSGYETNSKNLRKSTDKYDSKDIKSNTKEVSTKVKTEPKRRKKIKVDDIKIDENTIKMLRKGSKTIAKTSFFCPFFGVITMTSFLD